MTKHIKRPKGHGQKWRTDSGKSNSHGHKNATILKVLEYAEAAGIDKKELDRRISAYLAKGKNKESDGN